MKENKTLKKYISKSGSMVQKPELRLVSVKHFCASWLFSFLPGKKNKQKNPKVVFSSYKKLPQCVNVCVRLVPRNGLILACIPASSPAVPGYIPYPPQPCPGSSGYWKFPHTPLPASVWGLCIHHYSHTRLLSYCYYLYCCNYRSRSNDWSKWLRKHLACLWWVRESGVVRSLLVNTFLYW